MILAIECNVLFNKAFRKTYLHEQVMMMEYMLWYDISYRMNVCYDFVKHIYMSRLWYDMYVMNDMMLWYVYVWYMIYVMNVMYYVNI